MRPNSYEVNFDGIIGPTHNYSGLSYGNIASTSNKDLVSNPREAALQGIEKMKFIAEHGIVQGVLPPQERPHIPTLRSLGFEGLDKEIVFEAFHHCPEIFFACCSASSMWTANAATVTPSIDTADQRLHLTAANLSYEFHRSIESTTTETILQRIFTDPLYFAHHPPLLPQGDYFSDEGAANHTRFCLDNDSPGVHLFVYGRTAFKSSVHTPARFPARQTLEASQAVARTHNILPDRALFAQQNPQAIDAGVFHNDVISVGHRNLFLYHEKAFVDTAATIKEIKEMVAEICGCDMILLPVSDTQVPLADAVKSYLFNCQLIDIEDNLMMLVAPTECAETPSVKKFLDNILKDSSNPIVRVDYIDLRQSMRNGGGPACLRLRVPLSRFEIDAMNPNVLLSEPLYSTLISWVNKHYRDRLSPKDLADPELLFETQTALDELTGILGLGSLYSFQRLPGF